MKPEKNNSVLDDFIRNTLRDSDVNLKPFDWSEVEVLLRHEAKPISIGVNRKHLLFAGSAGLALLTLYGIIRLVMYYAAIPSDTAEPEDNIENSFSAVSPVDSSGNDEILAVSDSFKLDSLAAHRTAQHQDSLVAKQKFDSSTSVKDKSNIALPEKTPVLHKEKKKLIDTSLKQAISDSSKFKNIRIVPDTALSTAPQNLLETNNAPPPLLKNDSPVKTNNSKKSKKGLSPKLTKTAQDSSVTIATDSLKLK